MHIRRLLLTIGSVALTLLVYGQPTPPVSSKPVSPQYLIALDDARFDIGIKTVSVFALDDRAPLSANPHFQAMWNLVQLGASLESMLQGTQAPLNDLNMDKEFGKNGYNKTMLAVFFRYGFGESSDLKMQRQNLELSLSSGHFRQGKNGMNIHLDYQFNIANTYYGAGGNSLARAFDYEIFIGGRMGFDWSFQRSENESGFFNHLNNEIERIALENEFTATQLLTLEGLLEDSRILLPEDVGGRAFHFGPIAGGRLSRRLMPNTYLFLEGMFLYDVMDLIAANSGMESQRSQHQAALSLGIKFVVGGDGRGAVSFF